MRDIAKTVKWGLAGLLVLLGASTVAWQAVAEEVSGVLSTGVPTHIGSQGYAAVAAVAGLAAGALLVRAPSRLLRVAVASVVVAALMIALAGFSVAVGPDGPVTSSWFIFGRPVYPPGVPLWSDDYREGVAICPGATGYRFSHGEFDALLVVPPHLRVRTDNALAVYFPSARPLPGGDRRCASLP